MYTSQQGHLMVMKYNQSDKKQNKAITEASMVNFIRRILCADPKREKIWLSIIYFATYEMRRKNRSLVVLCFLSYHRLLMDLRWWEERKDPSTIDFST